ncbi:sulfite exporter TauE/SafE family protein [Occallatibacter riparius]|uniref:Probable membrane transporter protein n=1 Tax=Occallatibacter riparius TaxID=1002689 RepID=A0A9J7BSM1_9BACT|nr:sulfite exporter TauE/SafE family protein [Occallatibacter riparius]UWZ84754.1 sulfite exporter TauE/SafE family protein [Occallatibacter riparius]
MPHILIWPTLLFVALIASTLAAVTGFGGAAVLLPVLVAFFGMRAAVSILTIAQLIGNGSRVWFNRRELDWRVVGWFALGGVPMALIGGALFASAPLAKLTHLLGVFLLLVVVWRHLRFRSAHPFPTPAFAAIGAGSSFLSALVGSVGPIMAPFFLAYGLIKGAYIGTEALSTVVMHVTKLFAYGHAALLVWSDILTGIALGPVMILGSFLGKRIVARLPERVFVWVIEAVLVIAGFTFLIHDGGTLH